MKDHVLLYGPGFTERFQTDGGASPNLSWKDAAHNSLGGHEPLSA